MTDTTDIAALRAECANLMILLHKEELGVEVTLTAAKFFDDMFRLLEAERQRADGLAKELREVERLAGNELAQHAEKLAALKGEQPADKFKFAFEEWIEKTEWVQSRKAGFPFQYLGMHRADVMTKYIEHLEAENAAIKANFDELAAIVGFSSERCEQAGDSPMDCARELRQQVDNSFLVPPGLSPSTKNLVIGFANAMAAKLYRSEQKYGWSDGWMLSDWQDKCVAEFHRHIGKGDPVDVANYCAFMHYHGWPTALKVEQVPYAWVRISQNGVRNYSSFYPRPRKGNGDAFPLFTAPQKPVVIAPNRKDMSWTAANAGFVAKCDHEWKAAIEAAGGIVKDGE